MAIPYLFVSATPPGWDPTAEIVAWNWEIIPTLPPFILADGSGPASQQTRVRVCCDSQTLYVRFDCDDRDIWGSYTQRDEPIYDEEVVEVFLGPGEADPKHYYELEVSPNGVLFDAKIYNPTSYRAELEIDRSWDCPGLRWLAERNDVAGRWWAVLAIPWTAVTPPGQRPLFWRANFYRIERPHDAEPEFSGWSPTMTEPADFHKPAFFGRMELPGAIYEV
jgi:hypothetical protein